MPDKLIYLSRTTKWLGFDHEPIYLVTPQDFKSIPDGTVLTCINGLSHIKGKDEIDQDTRNGYLAFGLTRAQIDPVCLVMNKLDGGFV